MTTITSTDVLEQLAQIAPDSSLAAARLTRGAATGAIQASYQAIFTTDHASQFSLPERYEVARQISGWHGDRRLYEHFSAQQAELPLPSPHARLSAGLAHAKRLSRTPVSAGPEHLEELGRAGWSPDDIVTLSQLVGYVSFQSRLLRGYRLIDNQTTENNNPRPEGAAAWRTQERTRSGRFAPPAFTQQKLGWEPWIAPKPLAEFSAAEQAVLVNNGHADSDYFRLLGRNPPVLEQRTKADKGIFYTSGGLARQERELAATVASKINGCIYCASVHAAKAAQLSKQPVAVQQLLDTPPGGDLSLQQSARWRAQIDFAASLSATPAGANPRQIRRLRELGLSDLELLDLVQATAFFAWANRLMLTLGEPFTE